MKQIQKIMLVDNNDDFHALCRHWESAPILALDTEFIRTDTFYPIAGLLQVSDGKDNYLIDPLAVNDYSLFIELMVAPHIPKILHSCSEDLEVFDRLFKVLPRPLFDTQMAAAMAGFGFSLGYQRLVDELLGIHVPKGETRSNWLQRPLTDSQCHYAALDVEYLPIIFYKLNEKLSSLGRIDWLYQESQILIDGFYQSEPYYKRIKSSWKLSPAQLLILERLTHWREEQARQRDIPRGRILKDKSCFDIASRSPRDLKSLSLIEDISSKVVNRDGEAILALLTDAANLPKSAQPEALPRPLPLASTTIMKRLKKAVKVCAEELDIAQEILVKKRDYEALLRSGLANGVYQLPRSLLGWRKAVIGDELLKIVNE